MATGGGYGYGDGNPIFSHTVVDIETDKWKYIFDQYDEMRSGHITLWSLRQMLGDPEFRSSTDAHVLHVLEMKCIGNKYQALTYQEFINIVRNRIHHDMAHSRLYRRAWLYVAVTVEMGLMAFVMTSRRNTSFRLAVETEGTLGQLIPIDNYQYPYNPAQHPVDTNTCFRVMVRRLAKEFIADELDQQYYADKYTCCPPPVFLPAITFVEVGCFVYSCLEGSEITMNGPLPANSILIYRPDRRLEIWRFLLYMFIHAGWVHLFFNMLIQIMVGVPLEMVHGSCRIATVYLSGVLAGSLGTSVFDMNAFLVGASGGVYALLAGHLANILLNYTHMELRALKLASLLFIAIADVGFAVWDRYSRTSLGPPVGYTAHLMGALAGLTIGLVVLRNFEQKLHEQYMWWTALSLYLICVVFAIFWNIFYYTS